MSSPAAVLRQRLEEHGGSLPWREFMRLALFDPEVGYYAQNIQGLGRAGDFTTTPVIEPAFARAVWNWQRSLRKLHPFLENATFLEIGAGGGQFASAFLDCAGFFGKWRTEYAIVEVSRPLREQQQKLLRGKRVRWFASMEDAVRESGGNLMIFSNELVDAFPCSLWEWDGQSWAEVRMTLQNDTVFEFLEPAPLPDCGIFSCSEHFQPGQRVETHEEFFQWWKRWSSPVSGGAMLTIDYGGLGAGIYHRKPRGTLRGYWKQQRLEGGAVYRAMGRQDLTADVNYCDLVRWGETLAWKTLDLQHLDRWISSQQAAAAPESYLRNFLALEQIRIPSL